MLTLSIALWLMPTSSESGLSLQIVAPNANEPVVEAHVVGPRPSDVPIMKAGYSVFWLEAYRLDGSPVPLHEHGKAVKKWAFDSHGSNRDASFDIFGVRGNASGRRYGTFKLRDLYELKAGEAYRVRAVYDNRADGRPVFMRSGFIEVRG